MKTHASLSFLELSDARLFSTYVELRRREFLKTYSGLSSDFGTIDETDLVSRFVYALSEETLCGGARLTISTPGEPHRMPFEEAGVDLRDPAVLNALNISGEGYAEISRMAIDPRWSDRLSVSFGLGRELCKAAARYGIDTVFSICPPAPARLNRINAARCGVGFRIFERPLHLFGIEMFLCAYTGIMSAYAQEGNAR